MRYIIIVLLCVTIISCSKKDQLPDAPGTTLSRIDYYMSSNLNYSEVFSYDAQNKLTRLSKAGFQYDLTYTAQGRLASVAIKNGTPTPAVLFTFVYTHDANGRIIKKTTVPGTNSVYSDDRSYTYDASGRLITDSQYNGNTVARYIVYTYDNNNNVTESEQFALYNSSFVTYGPATFKYDNKISPYHQTGNLLYYITSFPTYLSKSNQLIPSENGLSDLKYGNKYYSNGLLRTSYNKDPYWSTYERAEYVYTQP
jgi:YD repeat-containing protein